MPQLKETPLSIEDALQKLTEALLANTEAVREDTANRIKGQEYLKSQVKSDPKATAAPKADPKPAESTPPTEKAPASASTVQPGGRIAMKEFLDGAVSEADRAARKAHVQEKLTKLGVTKPAEVKADDWPRLEKALRKSIAEWQPVTDTAGGSDDDDL